MPINNPYYNYNFPHLQSYAFVNGIEGAKSFPMQPNQTMLLMDSDNPVCYMKQSNSLGQSSLRYFKLQEVSETDIRNLNAPVPQQQTQYALKSDIDTLTSKIEELTKKLEVKDA